jgi:hypothetical protein
MRIAIMSFSTLSPQSYAGVEALSRDIDEAVVADDLDLDVAIVVQHSCEFRPEHGFGRLLAGRDADRACRPIPKLAHSDQLRLDLVEAWSHAGE